MTTDTVYENVKSGKRCYGLALMEAGLPMPIEKEEYPAYQVALRACRGD